MLLHVLRPGALFGSVSGAFLMTSLYHMQVPVLQGCCRVGPQGDEPCHHSTFNRAAPPPSVGTRSQNQKTISMDLLLRSYLSMHVDALLLDQNRTASTLTSFSLSPPSHEKKNQFSAKAQISLFTRTLDHCPAYFIKKEKTKLVQN